MMNQYRPNTLVLSPQQVSDPVFMTKLSAVLGKEHEWDGVTYYPLDMYSMRLPFKFLLNHA